MDFEWMAWTPVTAGFFLFIFACIATMCIWERMSPCVPRRGIIPLVTTRGDRLFMGLLGGAYILLIWAGLADSFTWHAPVLVLGFLAAMIRWG